MSKENLNIQSDRLDSQHIDIKNKKKSMPKQDSKKDNTNLKIDVNTIDTMDTMDIINTIDTDCIIWRSIFEY